MNLSGRIRVLGVIGHPIGHSSRMRDTAFAACGMDHAYLSLDVIPERLPAVSEGAVAPGGVSRPGKVVCDAVYRAGSETGFIEVARKPGARVVTADRMLLYRGVRARRLRTGREPDVEATDYALA